MQDETILEIKDLHAHFLTKQGPVKAVNGVNLELKRQSILGIMGESGSGKTTLALSILDLLPYPGTVVQGEIYYRGQDLLRISMEELRQVRGNQIAMVFQDPTTSLNPVIPIGTQVQEVAISHGLISSSDAKSWAIEALGRADLPDPEKIISQYPFELSGGMNQRVMLAMAMAMEPEVIIADEPTSAVDVTLQAHMLAQLKELRDEHHSSILLISHDLGIIAQMADMVAVMYAGSIVEYTDTVTLFQRPTHPYTWALLQSIPRLDAPDKPLRPLKGVPPDLINLPDECAYTPRCPKALNQCRISSRPPLEDVEQGHEVACYNPVRHD